MMKAWQIRENFELIDRIAISRRTFEELFTHTKELHYIDTEYQVVNKLTGEAHPTAGWLVDVLKG